MRNEAVIKIICHLRSLVKCQVILKYLNKLNDCLPVIGISGVFFCIEKHLISVMHYIMYRLYIMEHKQMYQYCMWFDIAGTHSDTVMRRMRMRRTYWGRLRWTSTFQWVPMAIQGSMFLLEQSLHQNNGLF